jgi:protein tyrosine/serine phosphatase
MRRLLNFLYNFHWIVDGEAARSAQAYAGFLRQLLQQNEIRTVVNLRGRNPLHSWWLYETKICRELHVDHHDIPVNSRTLPSRKILIEILDTFETSQKPLLIKCSGGQDRTSFAAALYILHRKGWAARSEALGQFAKWPYLHLPKRQQRWLRLFIIYADQEAKGRPLKAWVGNGYAPEGLMAWLDAQGMHDAFRNLPDQPARTLKNGLPVI